MGLLTVVSVYWVWEQDRVVRTFVATPVVVDSAFVEVHHGRKSTSYAPKVHYTYEVEGKRHESWTVYPISTDFSSRSGARWVIDQYPVGKAATAYVDPWDADNAVLIREYAAPPYWGAVVFWWLTLVGLMMAAGAMSSPGYGMRGVALGGSGFWLILPGKNLRRKKWESVAWTVGLVIPTVLLDVHYGMRGWPFGVGGWALLIVTAPAAGLVAVMGVRRWSMARTMSDARVQVSPVPVVRGEALIVQVEWDALKRVRVEGITAKLVCVEHYREQRGNKTNYGTREKGEQGLGMDWPKEPVERGGIVQSRGEAVMGATGPATTAGLGERRKKPGYPFYTWELRVEAKLAGAVDYEEKFFVDVG
jgi:hypothetical protein